MQGCLAERTSNRGRFRSPVFNPEQVPLAPDIPAEIVSIEPAETVLIEETEKSE